MFVVVCCCSFGGFHLSVVSACVSLVCVVVRCDWFVSCCSQSFFVVCCVLAFVPLFVLCCCSLFVICFSLFAFYGIVV